MPKQTFGHPLNSFKNMSWNLEPDPHNVTDVIMALSNSLLTDSTQYIMYFWWSSYKKWNHLLWVFRDKQEHPKRCQCSVFSDNSTIKFLQMLYRHCCYCCRSSPTFSFQKPKVACLKWHHKSITNCMFKPTYAAVNV